MSHYDKKEKRTLAIFIFIFILLTAGIFISGYISYSNFEKQFRTQAGRQLSSIAELKMNELVDWRRGRLADAKMLYQNHAFAMLIQAYFENPNNVLAEAQIQDWLKNYQENSEYDHVRLLDVEGQTHISYPIGLPDISSVIAGHIPEVLQSKQMMLFDFYRRDNDQQVRLCLLVPILDVQTDNQVIGLVAISINPQIYLYPFIKEWPINSTSAETLLVRRDGNNVLYLNEVRFNPNAALTLEFPITDTQLPAVKAVLGQSGVVQGVDYHGQSVLADVRAVPNSPWFLVSKMDIAEVDVPLMTRLWQTFGLAGMAILVAAAGLMTAWWQQRIQFYRTQAEVAEALRESETLLRESQNVAGLGSYVLDFSNGTWTSSDVLDAIFGIDKTFERSIAGWLDLVHPADRQKMNDYFVNEVIGKRLRFDKEYRIVRKNDGVERWVYGLGKLEFDAQDQLVKMIGTILDITERKNAEDALRESEDKFRYVFDNSVIGKSITLPSGEINVNKAFCEMLGFSREELIGRKWQEISHPDDIEETQKIVNLLLSGEKESVRFTKRYMHKNGSVVWTDVGTALRRDKDGKPLYFMTAISDITGRKLVEEALHKSEESLRLAVSAGRMGTWNRDFISGQLDWSVECKLMFGLSSEIEMNDERFMNALHPDDRVPTDMAISVALEKHRDFNCEYRVIWPDGTIHWIASQGRGYYNEAGQAIRMAGLTFDITERKRTEETLKASELKFRSAAEILTDIIYEWDLKDKVDWYGNIDGMMGFPNGEFPRTMSGWADMLHPNDRATVMTAVDAQLKHAIPYIVEYRIRRMDDTWRWWSARGTALRDEQGQPTRWIGSITDITERKRASDALIRSERKYRQLHESMMDGFVSVDMEGKFLECNEVYRNMLGYSEVELDLLTYIDITPEKWHAYETDVVQNQIMKRGYSDIYEKEYRRKDGTIFPVELHTVLSRDEYGQPSNMWAIVRDITERKRAEKQIADYAGHLEKEVNERTRELRDTQEQLVRQERLALLGQVAGSIGHELRNPLGIISNAAYFLKATQPNVDDKIKEYLGIIENETRAADKIVTDLLDFTRVKSLEREAVSVSELIRQTLERFPVPASVELTLEIPTDLPQVFVDPQQITQVLGNLTLNACQSLPEMVGRLNITAALQAELISIAIHDNGMGIPLENMKKLFEPLFTTKTKGIGLGLAVSQKLIEANGGRIEVQSEAGEGSTFTVWLPVYHD